MCVDGGLYVSSHETYIGQVWIGRWWEVRIRMSWRSVVWRSVIWRRTRLYIIEIDTHTHCLQ